jgi:hypothetical protein
MGGALLNKIFNLPTQRLSKEQYLVAVEMVKSKLKERFPDSKMSEAPSFKSKDSYGDADFLLERIPHLDYTKPLFEIFGYKPHVNGDCYSVPVKVGEGFFQVDIIVVNYFETALAYFNTHFGCLGGVVANTVGLRLGNDGLRLKIPLDKLVEGFPHHEFALFLITRDVKEIFEILDFNYEEFGDFNNEGELFRFIASSKYFVPSRFYLENLNHENRSRNKKRPEYLKFIEFCQSYFLDREKIDKAAFKEMILEKYPHIKGEIEEKKQKLQEYLAAREKFNGDLVTELTFLTGKELGDFIRKFKFQVSGNGDFRDYVKNHTKEEIAAEILDFANAKRV